MSRTGSPKAYIGRYYHALEQKGRLSIPAAYRSVLGSQAILTRGLDGCLFLFDRITWDKLLAQASSLPLTQKTARDWLRLLTNSAAVMSFDSLGRILIPDYLRETARLRKSVVIVGSLNRIELWDSQAYKAYLHKLESQAEAIAESLNPGYESN